MMVHLAGRLWRLERLPAPAAPRYAYRGGDQAHAGTVWAQAALAVRRFSRSLEQLGQPR